MDHRSPRPDQPYAWDDERLSAYLDGELSAPEQAQLEARLVVDPELRQLVDELRSVRQQLEILPEYRLQTTFSDQVLRRAEQEMLLAPVVRETTSVSIAAATTAMPAVSATAVEPSVAPLPHRSIARRWQRGAIWTAIAAAAVLLLIVTNRPLDPEQNHIAQNDPEPKLAVEHGAAKLPETPFGTAQSDSNHATFSASQDGVAARTGFDKLQRDAKDAATDPTANAPLAKQMEQTDVQKTQEKQSSVPPKPIIAEQENSNLSNNGLAAGAAPKPADAMPTKPTVPPLARTAGDKQPSPEPQLAAGGKAKSNDASDKSKLDAAGGKMLLKNQAFGAAPESQTTPRRKELSADLTAFFDSDDFQKLLTLPRDAKKRDEVNVPADEQILVVYLTPRAETATDRTFESLLTNNSIELAEKSLRQPTPESRQRSLAEPGKSSRPEAEPLAKAFSGKTEAAATQDRKATDARGASKPEEAHAAAQELQDKSAAPQSQLAAEHDSDAASEFYYLEADDGQVQELLRQLRVAPDRFTRLSIASREFPPAGARAEQSLEMKSSPATAGRMPAVASAADEPNREDEKGKQTQLAQAAPGTPPSAPPAPVVPVPAAEPSIAPMPAPTSTPKAAPIAAAPAMATLSNPPAPPGADAPAAAGAAQPAPKLSDDSGPKAESFFDNPGKSNVGQANESLPDADARSNRRALAIDQQLQAKGERVIAYRLRGLEALSDEGRKPAYSRGQEATAGAGGGGAGGFANTEIGKAPATAALQPGQSDKKSDKLETTDTTGQNSNGEMPGQSAKSGLAAPFSADASIEANASAETKAKDQSEALRMLTKNKEAELAQRNPPTEAAKKSAAPATKRVRVLFVIEHEPTK